jgi:hypothetical protein
MLIVNSVEKVKEIKYCLSCKIKFLSKVCPCCNVKGKKWENDKFKKAKE